MKVHLVACYAFLLVLFIKISGKCDGARPSSHLKTLLQTEFNVLRGDCADYSSLFVHMTGLKYSYRRAKYLPAAKTHLGFFIINYHIGRRC